MLLELHEDRSIDLDSSFHEEGKTTMNSVVVSGTMPILPAGADKNATQAKQE